MNDTIRSLHTLWIENHQLLKFKQTDEGLLYQYRGFDGFWNIIESDSLWARNIRFSNDSAEREQGIQLLSEISNANSNSNEFKLNNNNDYFVTCFCENDDCLSQWRGYAHKGGVSIGMEFRSRLPFHILKKEHAENETPILDIFLRPSSVIYADPNDKTKLKNELDAKDIFSNRENDSTMDSSANFQALIPYMKDIGFIEERELRIIIEEHVDCLQNKEFYKYIHFIKEHNKQIPYVIIKPGFSLYENEDKVVIRILINDADTSLSIKEQLENEISTLKHVEVIQCENNRDDCLCYGCSQRIPNTEVKDFIKGKYGENAQEKINEYYVCCCGEDNKLSWYEKKQSRIVISQGKSQENIFRSVDKVVQLHNKNEDNQIKVWCEGHLPIRTITVSPCENRDEIAESIRNYFKNGDQYWLKYVDVKTSSIPYRSPIE